ncbi:carboxylesterase family protein [Psychrobacter sp. B38]|uniref:carboxylesterase/lipase family protein n=1 Tax=Psychrobacter sp. B38 TaxID=3143538 RepID=UPI00320CB538
MTKLITRIECIIAICLCSLVSITHASENPTFIQQNTEGVTRTLGIPYAKPPVNSLRWRAPQTLESTAPIQNLGHFSDSCAQSHMAALGDNNVDGANTSEDCLYLNVWAPDDALEHPYPVLVWLHGGGFRIGGAAMPLYNAQHLAAQGAVVVTLNYRLGILGFFAHPAITEQGKLSGNFGLQDQIAALKFVHQHIAKFGGDDRNITLVGESAGGSSALYLMASKEDKKIEEKQATVPLFDKAIVQSGALDLPEYDRQRMEKIAATFAQQAGLNQENRSVSAQALRALPLSKVLAAEPQARSDTMPYIDGTGIGRSVYKTFQDGEQLKVPLIIGSNNYEAGFFDKEFSLRVINKMSAKQWQQTLRYTDGYNREGKYWDAAQVATDLFATLGTRQIARAHAASNTDTFRYYMRYVPKSKRQQTPGTIHTADVNYLFGNDIESDSRPFSQRLQKQWIHFAMTGNPSLPEENLDWPNYSVKTERLLIMDNEQNHVGRDPAADRLNYLESLGSFGIN